MVASLVHRTLLGTLERYVRDPWAWPRESDLVVDLVTELRRGLPSATVPTRLKLPSSIVEDAPGTARSGPRVRTEVRPRCTPSLAATRTKGKQHHRDRIDIGILKNDSVETVLHAYGARDVVLEVDADHLEALVEVKVAPDLYLMDDRCCWLEDVLKLLPLCPKALRAAIFIDTSLPIATVGLAYSRRRPGHLDPGRNRRGVPPWPVPDADFEVATSAGLLRFGLVDAPSAGGVFVWGLAVNEGSSWRAFTDPVARRVPLLPTEDVVPRCWAVTREDGVRVGTA